MEKYVSCLTVVESGTSSQNVPVNGVEQEAPSVTCRAFVAPKEPEARPAAGLVTGAQEMGTL